MEIFVSLTEVYHEDDGHVPHPLISLLHLLPNLRIFALDVLLGVEECLSPGAPLFNAIRSLKQLRRLTCPFSSMLGVSRLTSNMSQLLFLKIFPWQWNWPHPDVPGHDVVIPSLTQLGMFGTSYTEAVQKYLKHWTLTSLIKLEVYCVALTSDAGNSVILLRSSSFTSTLQTLDLSGQIQPDIVDLSAILQLLPSLEELSFVIEWAMQGPVRHAKLNRVGFYGGGTLFEFRGNEIPPEWLEKKKRSGRAVSSAAANLPSLSKSNFPRLATVRLLSEGELHYFLSRGGAYALDELKSAAWLEWRKQCAIDGILVEDCTGNEFGTWPQIPGSDNFCIVES